MVCNTVKNIMMTGLNTIPEYAEFKGSHKVHCVQLLALHSTIPKSHTMCWEHCQMLLELCHAGLVTTALRSLFQCPNTLWGKNLFLIPSPNLPSHNFRPFPQVLLSPQSRDQCCPCSSSHNEVATAVRSIVRLFQAEQTQWPQPLLTPLPFKAFHHLCNPSLDTL